VPNQTLLYQIAFTIIPGIGDIVGKKLISYCGGVEAVFTEKKDALLKIPGIGQATVNNIINHSSFERAEKEINFILKNNIKPLFYTDSDYPQRLLNCEDGKKKKHPCLSFGLGYSLDALLQRQCKFESKADYFICRYTASNIRRSDEL